MYRSYSYNTEDEKCYKDLARLRYYVQFIYFPSSYSLSLSLSLFLSLPLSYLFKRSGVSDLARQLKNLEGERSN